ncbi:MAG: PaaI family thioesterase [Clostridiaceae bacterium]
MKYKITKKQQNSNKCIVCGLNNELGLKASFYELDNDELVAIFKPIDEHQSYPGRMHGGISSAILDETIGRAILIKDENMWGVTTELTLKYKKPVPLNEELKVVGRVTKDSRRLFEGTGEIILKNGDVAVTAEGKYIKMPINKITDSEFEENDWRLFQSGDEPDEIEL